MSKKVKVDFTGVEAFNRPSVGEHVARITSADLRQSQGGNDMIVVAFTVIKGEDKDSRVMENYPLAENALWKLKAMLQALGLKVDGKVQIDLDKLIGKTCIIDVIDDEYNGQTRAKVGGYKKLSSAADDDDDEEDDDVDSEEEEDEEEEEKPTKKPAKKAAPKKAPMPEPEEDEDDDDDWDDDEEEEEEKPAKKAKKPAKQPPKKSKKAEPEDDDDDDDDWDE